MDVDEQPALPGAVAEPEVGVRDGAGLEWAVRPPLSEAALSSHHVMATSWQGISLHSPNPPTWHSSQASSQPPLYACAQHWPQRRKPWSPVLVG